MVLRFYSMVRPLGKAGVSGEGARATAAVGLIGLGKMGIPVARTLMRVGYSIVGCDAAQAQCDAASLAGIRSDPNPSELVGADPVFILVATGAQVMATLSAPPYSSGCMAGSTVVVLSTIGPQAAREVAHLARLARVRIVDAPVTGGVQGAESAQLTIFASGAEDAVRFVTPHLAALGTIVRSGGQVGDGQSYKVVNNMLATAHLAVAAEALALAASLDLDRDLLLAAMRRGSGSSWMLQDRGERLIAPERRREAHTYLEILAKDAELVVLTAEQAGFNAPLASAVRQQWRNAIAGGLGRQDDSAIISVYESEDLA